MNIKFYIRVINRCFSTNNQRLNIKNRKHLKTFGWKNATWPNYLVWNNYQLNFLNQIVNFKKDIKIVGPIWFQDTEIKFNQKINKFITIFDVSPPRKTFYKLAMITNKHYIFEKVRDFINDIVEIAEELNYIPVLKIKRELSRIHDPRYIHYLNDLINKQKIVLIAPDISAFDLIKKSKKVISFPFTSTSIIAKSIGIPSIFYDPYDCAIHDNDIAQGVEVISDKNNLKNWIENN